jgi:hypothetical protein
MERGNFNNPPNQSVAPLKMGWLTNYLVRWIVERSHRYITMSMTDCINGWMNGWMNILKNKIKQR